MIPVSDKFKQALANDYRAYITYAEFTLANGYQLTVSGDQIWANGLVINDAVSSDTQLEVGSAIINSATLVINNMYDEFTQYTFEGATCEVYVGLRFEDGTEERVKKGVFNVDTCDYTSDLITINLLDNMSKFDVSYELSTLTPTWDSVNNKYTSPTLLDIVVDACTTCGVGYYISVPNNYVPQEYASIDKSQYTFRDIIQFVAQIEGKNATINANGELEFTWYDIGSLVGAFGSLDGGGFTTDLPLSEGAGCYAPMQIGQNTTLYATWIKVHGIRIQTVSAFVGNGTSFDFRHNQNGDGYVGVFYGYGSSVSVTQAMYGYGMFSGGNYIKFQVIGELGAGNPFSFQVYFLESGDAVLYFDKVPEKPTPTATNIASLAGSNYIAWDDVAEKTPYVSRYVGSAWVMDIGDEYLVSGARIDANDSPYPDDGFPIGQRNNMVRVSDADVLSGTLMFRDNFAFSTQDDYTICEISANRLSSADDTVHMMWHRTHLSDPPISYEFKMHQASSAINYLYTTDLFFQYGTCSQYGDYYKIRYEGILVSDSWVNTFDYYSLSPTEIAERKVVVEAYCLYDGLTSFIVPIQLSPYAILDVSVKPTDTGSWTSGMTLNFTTWKTYAATSSGASETTLTTGNANGGVIGSSYTDPRNGCHVIDECYSTRFAKDDITITGVRVVVDRQVEVSGSTEEQTVVFTTGSSDYMIQISDNPLIPTTSDADAQFIADYLGAVLIGTTFRTAQLTHSSDPTIEGGDVALAIDRKGRAHPILVTSTTFSSSAAQNTQCSAESVSDNRANRKTASESLYDKVIDTVNKLIAANQGSGLADYVVAKGTSGSWYYQHWNSGRKEAWFSGSVSTGSTWTASGNVYRATWSTTIPSAVGFDSTPKTIITQGASAQNVFTINGGASSKTAVSGYAFRGASASSSSSLTISIYAWTN